MPRSSRNAARNPANNRTDLINPPEPQPQAISAAPNQEYGVAGAQIAAQHAIPMAGGATPPSSTSIVPAAPRLTGQALGQQAAADSIAHNGPSGPMELDRPTERPNEPVTHGLPVGPGGGPEVLTGVGAAARDNAVQRGSVTNLLQNLASQPGATSAIRDLANRAASGVA